MSLHAVVIPGKRALPWIVWLHGFLGAGSDWQEITSAFANPQLLIDLPGHGASHAVSTSGFAQTRRLLQNTLINYNILSYWLVGYSLGGRVAMYHACRQPEGLRGLIAEGAHPGLTTGRERDERRASDHHWAARFTHQPLERVLDEWYRQPVFASLSEAQRQQFIALRRDNHPAALSAMLTATSLARQPDLRARLAKLPVPFHFLCGERDTRFQAIAQSIAARCHTLPDAGHNAHRENPQAFCACLTSILHASSEENL